MRELELLYSRHNVTDCAYEIEALPIPYADLTVVIKGSIEYEVDGESVTLNEGDVIFMTEGTKRGRRRSGRGVDYISFNFTCEHEYDIPTVIRRAVNSETLLLIAAYDKIESRKYLDNREKIESILACLLAVFEDRVRTENFNPMTIKIIKYINANLSSRITLEDIGELTFFSPIYLFIKKRPIFSMLSNALVVSFKASSTYSLKILGTILIRVALFLVIPLTFINSSYSASKTFFSEPK